MNSTNETELGNNTNGAQNTNSTNSTNASISNTPVDEDLGNARTYNIKNDRSLEESNKLEKKAFPV